jgi:two-component system, chemotaxis family, sensor kinase CheA
MSGFNIAELMPFYLDETDEHIAGLNDSLLRLEQDPTDARALQEAFRMFHSIKGASVVMGFAPVNKLTHHLESLYDQLRLHKRSLDRPLLDLTFRALDELRDYHTELRSQGQSGADLSALTADVIAELANTRQPVQPAQPPPDAVAHPEATPKAAASTVREDAVSFEEPEEMTLTVIFEPNLPLADMKARLVLNRVSARAHIISSDPAAERLDEVDPLTQLIVRLASESNPEELRALADVEGVIEVRIEHAQSPTVATTPSETLTVPSARSDAAELEIAQIAPARIEPDPAKVPTGPTPATGAPHHAEPPAPKTNPAAQVVPNSLAASAERPAAAAPPKPEVEGKKKIAETIRVESDRLDYLMNLAGELVITKARFVAIARELEEVFRGSNAHSLTSDTRERIDSMTRGLEGLEGLSNSKTSNGSGSIDRWSAHVRRLKDNFRDIEGELDRIRLGRERIKSLAEAIHSLGRVSDSLQKGVLDTRMVPIGPLFERFRRVIRDLSHSSGKEVTLRIAGEKTELDKRMIDELSDPLIHMVRNAVDHGLESPDRREASGKPRAGTVSLLASHRGNSVVITVSDDGHGIDCERIRQKIVAKGLVGKAEAQELTARDLVTYIWHPGLSTAETITEVSGRGVGMDIVKSRIENLSGVVDVRSNPGQGTTFTIRLPLTLAIMSSLLVRIHEEFYAIPLDHIEEIVEVGPAQIYRLQGRAAVQIRKKIVALIALDDIFLWGGGPYPGARNGRPTSIDSHSTGESHDDKRTVVVVQNGETTIGLLVDQLIGMQEVVLKSLEKNFRTIRGLSGASILGDGRVSLILDLDAVVEMAGRAPEHIKK